MNRKINVRALALTGLMAAFAAIVSVVSIPTPFGFPITFQVLAVAICGFLLGSKRGTIAVGIFLLLGAIGLPVFSLFRGGFGHFFSPTGGFLWSFPILAWLCGKGQRNILWGYLGLILNYLAGGLQLALATNISAALLLLPCLAKDGLLIFFAAYLAKRVARFVDIEKSM
ncbi:MAG: biotin transporter BioY [Clostridia bacterium]|nr:biotin transporter BioY [Clostridia bacterium]